MKIENKNGVTHIFDFEIDKALTNLERGIPLADFFKYEAERFEYGKEGYFKMLEKEIEDYESRDWDYLIETNKLHPYEISEIIEGVNEIKKVIIELQKLNIQPPAKQLLETNLTDEQRGELFKLLLSNKYIAPLTNEENFIWAFGGEKKPANWQPIEWIDKSVTRKEPNIQTLFELLYLLRVDKDTKANNPNNLYRKMEFCFKGLVNIAAKNPSSIKQNTIRQRLLKTILEEVENVEAQK